jgi:hypothetical protein
MFFIRIRSDVQLRKIVAFVTQASTSVPGEVLNAAEVSIK